jgi:hypothetical protein
MTMPNGGKATAKMYLQDTKSQGLQEINNKSSSRLGAIES